MIVAEQMENGVDGKEADLSFKGVSVFLGLAFCFFGGNDDVTERDGVTVKRTSVRKLLLFPHGEGENVRGSVLFAVFAVELVDPFVIHKADGDLSGIFEIFLRESLGDGLCDQAADLEGDLYLVLFG